MIFYFNNYDKICNLDWSGHVKNPNRFGILWKERRVQVLHGAINHGIGGVAVLVAAIFVMVID